MKPLEKEENIRTEAWLFTRRGLPFAIACVAIITENIVQPILMFSLSIKRTFAIVGVFTNNTKDLAE